jgi:hypothetical protein
MREGTDREHGRAKRIFLVAAIMTALLGSLVSANASLASAATAAASASSLHPMTTTSWWMYTWSHPNCIDDSRAHGLRSIRCDGYNYQLWYQVYRGGIKYAFQNHETGLCIDDSRAHGLRAIKCDGYNYQEWRVTPAAHNSSELQNVNTGLCLDNSRGIRAIKCNRYSTNQDWL